ncbi:MULTISPECIES: FkbM family methyltransferase [Falsihalocynthiibacter]|uniref:FkbM family methyltransferase n=1 Tax=Falsihalocynthiibacter TaxID=2854182 RepID=UPI003002127E
MKRLYGFIQSIFRDGPIIGYGPYLKYRLKLPRLSAPGAMKVCVGGQDIYVRPGTSDLRVAFQNLRTEFDILSDLLPKDFSGLIIDAGGYIGTAALQLARMYPAATIITIEPSSQNYAMLLRNVSAIDRIVPINAALHTEAGQSLELVDHGTGEWGFSIMASDTGCSSMEIVQTVSLPEIAARYPSMRIGIIKIDIEGSEKDLFENSDKTLSTAEAVFIELHDRMVPGCTELFRNFSRDRWILNAGGEKLLSLRKQSNDAPHESLRKD